MLAVLVLSEHDFFFVFNFMELSLLCGSLLGQSLLQKRLLLVILLGFTAALLFERFFEQGEQLIR